MKEKLNILNRILITLFSLDALLMAFAIFFDFENLIYPIGMFGAYLIILFGLLVSYEGIVFRKIEYAPRQFHGRVVVKGKAAVIHGIFDLILTASFIYLLLYFGR